MKSAVVFVLLALVAGMVIGDRFWGSAKAQVQRVYPEIAESTWPPNPEDMVAVAGRGTFGSVGQTQALYTVPVDQTLVATFVQLGWAYSVMLDGAEPQLVEISASGGDSVKTNAFDWTNEHQDVGWVFGPTSTAALKSTVSSTALHYWELRGYVSDRERSRVRWPPTPEMIVNVHQEFVSDASARYTIFTVPSTHWLVVTAMWGRDTAPSYPSFYLDVIQVGGSGGGEVRRLSVLPHSLGYDRRNALASVGYDQIPFEPGSQVVVEGWHETNPPSVFSGTADLMGYLVPR